MNVVCKRVKTTSLQTATSEEERKQRKNTPIQKTTLAM
jgi:hypothetical protein